MDGGSNDFGREVQAEAVRAFTQLYPRRAVPELSVHFSARFHGYNASVRGTPWKVQFRLAKRFVETSAEIRIGVLQHLLNKLYGTRIETLEQDLYSRFLKKLPDYAPVTRVDATLRRVFDELNEEYFNGFMMTPNLRWGRGVNLLGHYTFSTDTIVVSEQLREDPLLLRFVLFHEMLHKKHGFDETPGGVRTHTRAFREDERRFNAPGVTFQEVERRLAAFVRRKRRERRTGLLRWWR